MGRVKEKECQSWMASCGSNDIVKEFQAWRVLSSFSFGASLAVIFCPFPPSLSFFFIFCDKPSGISTIRQFLNVSGKDLCTAQPHWGENVRR